jgi:hypothetical protein
VGGLDIEEPVFALSMLRFRIPIAQVTAFKSSATGRSTSCRLSVQHIASREKRFWSAGSYSKQSSGLSALSALNRAGSLGSIEA